MIKCRPHMAHTISKAVFVAALLVIPQITLAATVDSIEAPVVIPAAAVKAVAKKTIVKAPVKAASCVRCKSLAEGADVSKASKADEWTGLVIGLNLGSHEVVITEANKLNHIKAYAQRNIVVDDDTTVITQDDDEKRFDDVDIGYRISVKGVYDAKKRSIKATTIEIMEVPDAPITKTK